MLHDSFAIVYDSRIRLNRQHVCVCVCIDNLFFQFILKEKASFEMRLEMRAVVVQFPTVYCSHCVGGVCTAKNVAIELHDH